MIFVIFEGFMNKILILGASPLEIEIIENAKQNGLYTIVTDSNTDWNFAPAKKIADEAWNISWSDIETLKNKCQEVGIKSIMAGFSEKRIDCAHKLAEILSIPFYSKNSKLDVINDKLLFKDFCENCGIKVPSSYHMGESVNFPIIVKPVDNAGSRGISVCYNQAQLNVAYEDALNYSNQKKVVIEDYLDGDEVVIYFLIHNSKINLLGMCDRNMEKFDKNTTQLPFLYTYPSKYLEIFKKYNLNKFKQLIRNLNIENGMIGFQSFVKGNDIIPYDPTYRLDGSFSYHIFEKIININPLSLMINHSLTGTMGNDESISISCEKNYNNYGYTYIVLLKKGKIKHIEGLEKIKERPGFVHITQQLFVGDVLEHDYSFSQIFARILFVSKTKSEIKKNIIFIRKNLKILDEHLNSIIINDYELEDKIMLNKNLL